MGGKTGLAGRPVGGPAYRPVSELCRSLVGGSADSFAGGRRQLSRARHRADSGGRQLARVEPGRVPGQDRDLVVALRQVDGQLEQVRLR